MEKVFYCEQCPGSELRQTGITKTKKNKAYPHGIRVRRFICDVCDNKTAIYSDGERDSVIIPAVLVDEVKEIHKQESDSAHRLIEPIQ